MRNTCEYDLTAGANPPGHVAAHPHGGGVQIVFTHGGDTITVNLTMQLAQDLARQRPAHTYTGRFKDFVAEVEKTMEAGETKETKKNLIVKRSPPRLNPRTGKPLK